MRPYLAASVAIFMAWARKRLRFGGWLALLALALQLALSFGHIHAEDFAPTANIQTAIDADQGGGIPADPEHHGLGHHDCGICATLSLLATLVIPSPPTLTTPATHEVASFDATDSRQNIGAVPRFFQARAPPRA